MGNARGLSRVSPGGGGISMAPHFKTKKKKQKKKTGKEKIEKVFGVGPKSL